MEKEFFDLYERSGCLSLEVGHNSIADWCIDVHDIKGKSLGSRGDAVISLQDCSREVLFAKAYVALTEHLCETRGGY